ncbi:MAG: hypothetical protein ACI89E_002103, partial [Planctomycetota bacterium]
RASRRVHPALVSLLCLASIVAGTYLLANFVWALDAQLLAEIDKYDPGTPESERASDEWASDTSRSFMLLLSPALTAIWNGVSFLMLFGMRWIARERHSARYTPVNTSAGIHSSGQQGVDGNPQNPNIVGEQANTERRPKGRS